MLPMLSGLPHAVSVTKLTLSHHQHHTQLLWWLPSWDAHGTFWVALMAQHGTMHPTSVRHKQVEMYVLSLQDRLPRLALYGKSPKIKTYNLPRNFIASVIEDMSWRHVVVRHVMKSWKVHNGIHLCLLRPVFSRHAKPSQQKHVKGNGTGKSKIMEHPNNESINSRSLTEVIITPEFVILTLVWVCYMLWVCYMMCSRKNSVRRV